MDRREKNRAKAKAKRAEKKRVEAHRLQRAPVCLPLVEQFEERSPEFRIAVEAARSALRGERTPERVGAAAAMMAELVDSVPVPGAACARGCSYCCHVIVHVNLADLEQLVRHIRARFSETEIADLRERARATAAKTHGRYGLSYPVKTPCVLLRDGECSAYEARPLACRGEHSLDVEVCRQAYEAPQGVDVVVEDSRNYEAKADAELPRLALDAAMSERGIGTRSYELQEALAIALERPDAFERWLKGENVFAAAECGAGVLAAAVKDVKKMQRGRR